MSGIDCETTEVGEGCLLSELKKALLWEVLFSDSAGIRTQDPRLKRPLLYRLSYAIRGLHRCANEVANILLFIICALWVILLPGLPERLIRVQRPPSVRNRWIL
jgi:hypothetical protein